MDSMNALNFHQIGGLHEFYECFLFHEIGSLHEFYECFAFLEIGSLHVCFIGKNDDF